MPAPRTPNTGPALAARRRGRLERLAAELRAAGWAVTPPPADTLGHAPHAVKVVKTDDDGFVILTDDPTGARLWRALEQLSRGAT